MADEAIEIPIFELPLAIIPGELVPLHIFEERYKRMINHSIDEREPFGIRFRDSDGSREVGCTALVERVLERHEDGKLDIVAVGGQRFRVLEDRGHPEDPRALVEPLVTSGSADPADAHSAFTALLDAVGNDAPDKSLPTTAYGLAALVELGSEFKQELLEADDEERRMVMVRTELRRLTAQVKKAREMAELAKTNGHGPVSGLAR